MRAKEGGKETTGETAFRQPSVPFPWSLAAHHQWLAKNKAPEEEAALHMPRVTRILQLNQKQAFLSAML